LCDFRRGHHRGCGSFIEKDEVRIKVDRGSPGRSCRMRRGQRTALRQDHCISVSNCTRRSSPSLCSSPKRPMPSELLPWACDATMAPASAWNCR